MTTLFEREHGINLSPSVFYDLRQYPESIRVEVEPRCRCPEATILVIEGAHLPPVRTFPAPPGHSCGYVRRRNALIPRAEQIADLEVGKSSPYWGRTFMAAMERLVAEAYAHGKL